MVAGTGDTDNELFEIAPDGTLKTRVVFDCEAGNLELAIRLEAVDSRFNSVEDSLTVRVSDILLPNVQTGEARLIIQI